MGRGDRSVDILTFWIRLEAINMTAAMCPDDRQRKVQQHLCAEEGFVAAVRSRARRERFTPDITPYFQQLPSL